MGSVAVARAQTSESRVACAALLCVDPWARAEQRVSRTTPWHSIHSGMARVATLAAVALLTTFYGAILGTVIMAPLSVKLEKRSGDEALLRTLIITAAASMARQDNPRRLEMLLNADLPPTEQIIYFD